MKKPMTFEKSLNRLIEIVDILEADSTTLEKSLTLYKEGLALSQQCDQTLSNYESEVLQLQKKSESAYTTVPFDAV
jgi:exodeoxyribonuclease VII small subunit